jgi:threonylcarbamoyladenosine tRNA methylthiotransferase CDKAL1
MCPAMIHRSLKPPQIIETLSILRKSKPKVWVEAYGCSASMADSEMISGLLKQAGYEITANQNESALNLIVTCSVKDRTEHRMLSRIARLTNSGKPLIVAGCLPKADRAKVELLNSSASLLGPICIDKSPDAARSALAGTKLVALEDSPVSKVNLPRIRLNPAVSIVEIASGCMSQCSFCQTKLAKGALQSYRIGEIVRQIKCDIKSGCKEVWLSSTDNGCYGRDIDTNLVELLDACCAIEGSFKIRLGMMNPMYLPPILDKMVALFCKNDKMFKFVHIPVQSGSDRILKKMKRGHTAKTFINVVHAFRDKIPKMTICTDIIVGFPSESKDDFKETLDLIARSEPDIINISRYAARPGTEAYRWKGIRVESQVSKERSESVHALATKIARKRNSLWQDWQGEIVIDEIGKVVQGRNYAYKPVVLSSSTGDRQLGERVWVKVHSFSSFSLKANLIL